MSQGNLGNDGPSYLPTIDWIECGACLTLPLYTMPQYGPFCPGPSPPHSSTTYSLTWHGDMSGSATAEIIRNTWGIAVIGLAVEAVCAFSLCLPIPLLILPTHSLYGVTITQMWAENFTFPSCGLIAGFAGNSGDPDGTITGNKFSFFRIATQHWMIE
jgi:hypothetical protein